jgi:hypothetical protein
MQSRAWRSDSAKEFAERAAPNAYPKVGADEMNMRDVMLARIILDDGRDT